jgi:hypothetical protein
VSSHDVSIPNTTVDASTRRRAPSSSAPEPRNIPDDTSAIPSFPARTARAPRRPRIVPGATTTARVSTAARARDDDDDDAVRATHARASIPRVHRIARPARASMDLARAVDDTTRVDA